MAGRIVNVLRSAPAVLLAPESYLRAVFVLTGAALALALGIADFTMLSLVARAGAPAWATALTGVVLVGGPLLAGLVPAVRQVEGAAVQTLLASEFPDGPPGPAPAGRSAGGRWAGSCCTCSPAPWSWPPCWG